MRVSSLSTGSRRTEFGWGWSPEALLSKNRHRKPGWFRYLLESIKEIRQERRDNNERQSLAIQMWLEEKAPTERELRQLPPRVEIDLDGGTAEFHPQYEMPHFSGLAHSHPPTPFPPASAQDWAKRKLQERRGRDLYGNPIKRPIQTLRLQEFEPEWTLSDMLEAHRVGATALDTARKVHVDEFKTAPFFSETVDAMWDPRFERGPRELAWCHTRAKRNQPRKTSRAKRSSQGNG